MPLKSKNLLPLSRFILRSRSLKLYRNLLRAIKNVSNEDYRKDLRIWVREDFEKNKNHTDEEIIKYHIARGEAFYEKLMKTLYLSGNT